MTLCRLHHRLVHEGQIRIETAPEGGWRFVHPDGRHYEVIRCTAPEEYTGEELAHTHADLGIHIDADTAATRWRGERMDYELGVWVLCQQVERARAARDGDDSDSMLPVIAALPRKRRMDRLLKQPLVAEWLRLGQEEVDVI